MINVHSNYMALRKYNFSLCHVTNIDVKEYDWLYLCTVMKFKRFHNKSRVKDSNS